MTLKIKVSIYLFSNLIPRVLATFSGKREGPGDEIVAFSKTKWRKTKGQLTLWKNRSILFVLVWMKEFTWSYEMTENSEENYMWVMLCIVDLFLLSDAHHKLGSDTLDSANSFLVIYWAFVLNIVHLLFTSVMSECDIKFLSNGTQFSYFVVVGSNCLESQLYARVHVYGKKSDNL